MFSLVILVFAAAACNANHFQRIVNGTDTDITKHPWQLSLQYNGSHTCGAVLIREDIALTAAHCVQRDQLQSYTIVAGVTKLSESSNMRFGIAGIRVHENYDKGPGFIPNDIAILYLSQNLTLSGNIANINLASRDTEYEKTYCYITGWGRTSGSGPIPDILQKADTNVMNTTTCKVYFGSNVADDPHVCVRTGYNGGCNGDSGGPLVCISEGKEDLVGLASFVRSGCLVTHPTVYARVSTYLDWIAIHMDDPLSNAARQRPLKI